MPPASISKAVAIAVLSSGLAARAATWYVATNSPADGPGTSWTNAFHTIQQAVDSASDGDIVLVTDGVYKVGARLTPGYSCSNRVVITNDITLRSVNGPEYTMIKGWPEWVPGGNGTGAVRCVYMTAGELEGFTICNGHTLTDGDDYHDRGGGGVYCSSDDIVVSNCVIVSNSCNKGGGGVHGGTVRNSILKHNEAYYKGGGAHFSHLENCILQTNMVYNWYGGGAYDGEVRNCVLAGNVAGCDGGGYASGRAYNSIIVSNLLRGVASVEDTFNITASNCCAADLSHGVGGNITNDPLFVDYVGSDFHLSAASPCIDAGNNDYTTLAGDLDGRRRPQDGDGDAIETVDMGCYEYPGAPQVVVTNADDSVPRNVTSYSIGGTADVCVVGGMWWTNMLNGSNGTFSAAPTWQVADVPLTIGSNTIAVFGSNAYGRVTNDSVTITRMVGGVYHYVSINGRNVSPYTNWVHSARVLQDAVDAAWTDDFIIVSNGFYDTGGRPAPGMILTNRIMVDKPLTIRSVNGSDVTGIMGSGGSCGPDAVRCAYLCPGTVLEGFSLGNGVTAAQGDINDDGGGAWASNAVLTNCYIGSCRANGRGGGVMYGTLYNCRIEQNIADFGGGACKAELNDCRFLENEAQNGAAAADCDLYNCLLYHNISYGIGGGALSSRLYNCTVYENQAASSGGGAEGSEAHNCIFSVNIPDNWTNGILYYSRTEPLPAGGQGNIDDDPAFVDEFSADFHLLYGSPCIDSGTNPASPDHDLEGTSRPRDGDYNGTSDFDMGCYEYEPATADSNGDGVPDWWYHQYGLSPIDPDTGLYDSDGDGPANGDEYVADTDPTDSNNYFNIAAVDYSNSCSVAFDCSTGRVYGMQYRPDLLTGGWNYVEGQTNIMGDASGTLVLSDTNTAALRYYRVRVEVP